MTQSTLCQFSTSSKHTKCHCLSKKKGSILVSFFIDWGRLRVISLNPQSPTWYIFLDIAVSFRLLYSVTEKTLALFIPASFCPSICFKTPPRHTPLLLSPSETSLSLALKPRVARIVVFYFKQLDTSRKDSSQLQDISFLLWLQDRKTN